MASIYGGQNKKNVPSAIKRIEDLGWREGKMWKKTKINLVFIGSEALPVTRQLTRSTKSLSSNTCIPKQSRTVTYQRSFFIHVHVLQMELPAPWVTQNPISLASFKSLLLQYYNEALHLHDVDDIRTWRTICPRSEVQYTEDSPALALLLYFLPSFHSCLSISGFSH